MATRTEIPTLEDIQRTLRRNHPGRRGKLLASFAEKLHARTSPAYLSLLSLEQLAAGIEDMYRWLETREPDRFSIRTLSPSWLETASGERRTSTEVTGPDQPFLVDTLRELLRARRLPVLELFHPILALERGEGGKIVSLQAPGTGGQLVSFMHLETRELGDEERSSLESEAREVFREARQVVLDFPQLTARTRSTMTRLQEWMRDVRDNVLRETLAEAIEFLEWLLRANFVFLGAREYKVEPNGSDPTVRVVPGSGLGILRDDRKSSMWPERRLSELPPDLRRRVLEPVPLTVHKTNTESRVLRRTRMDYIGIKEIDPSGRVLGEQRFLGLFTARALSDLPANIPVLRQKLKRIIQDVKVVPGSHDHKEIFSIFCSLPKSQLFLYDADSLRRLVLEIHEQRDRRGIRIHYHADPYELTQSVMVLIPRERFNAEVRQAIQAILLEEFDAGLIGYHLALTEEPLARLHFHLATKPGGREQPAIAELESKVAAVTESWPERVAKALRKQRGLKEGTRLAAKFANAFPPSYSAQESVDRAVEDIRLVEETLGTGRIQVRISGNATGPSSIKIARAGDAFHLSRLMPTLTNLGLDALDETSYRIAGERAAPVFIHCFRVFDVSGKPLPQDPTPRNLEATILNVLEKETADDSLNNLVILSGVTWREVELLRAYTAYLQQLEGGAVRQRTAFLFLRRHSSAARALVDLFLARFDPDLPKEAREERQKDARARLEETLDRIDGIQEDQVLRSYDDLIRATVRTNYFQVGPGGRRRPAIALKVEGSRVSRMPHPRPLYEIFVSSPRLEGVHLRTGKVARGGIRWSDRVDDYRTEILGLMRAQRTKNALIVPVGAKGGFVLRKKLSAKHASEEVRRQYEVFIGSLLDLTDNRDRDKRLVHPERTVVYDEGDPYLVVAADRGTAQFSNLANRIAVERSFWLGDAFASGGSTGYNHKEVGITARGAWECVKRHFRALGKDIRTEEFSVAGIGDMSGDVFGNGMLLSRKIRLVAAFNHQHIFIDPSPDPETSWRERKRLFELPRSTWKDYDVSLISPGGGVFSRNQKSIRLSPEARELLKSRRETLNGNELVREVLKLPVDLLWNGGIGTYIKASSETHLDVGDPSNDLVRVDASEIRARVLGEGGNLGITPWGRVEFAGNGGRLNADFIDNSAGVDLSDHEVNLKILLDEAVKNGRLDAAERNHLLKAVEQEVCEQVLEDNRLQSDAISLEAARSVAALSQHRLLVAELEERGLLHRELEAIPEIGEMERLAESSIGLTRPQLSVCIAYAKIDAYGSISATQLASDELLKPYLYGYFPARFREKFAEEIEAHPLRREITVTEAVNECVNRMGFVFLHRVAREENEPLSVVLHAFVLAARLTDSDRFHEDLARLHESADASVGDLEEAMTQHADAVEGLVRWVLRQRWIERRDGSSAERKENVIRLRDELAAGASSRIARLRESFPRLASPFLAKLLSPRLTLEAAEISHLRELTSASVEACRAALHAAAERLLLEKIEREAFRMVKSESSDWQMAASLLSDLHHLRLELAQRVLVEAAASSKDGGASREAAIETVRKLVSSEHPLRLEATRTLDRSHGQQPVTPSGLYVLVENLRRMIEGPRK